MAKWTVVVSPEQFESERLYGADRLTVPGVGDALAAGDEVLLIAAVDEPVVFGVARADGEGALRYTVNLLEAPQPAPDALVGEPGVHAVDPKAFDTIQQIVKPADPAAVKRTWLVSVDMPIEAASPGEAVRTFWNYVRELGPAELPAFVWPVGDELAMQAFVLGAEANQDPEED